MVITHHPGLVNVLGPTLGSQGVFVVDGDSGKTADAHSSRQEPEEPFVMPRIATVDTTLSVRLILAVEVHGSGQLEASYEAGWAG